MSFLLLLFLKSNLGFLHLVVISLSSLRIFQSFLFFCDLNTSKEYRSVILLDITQFRPVWHLLVIVVKSSRAPQNILTLLSTSSPAFRMPSTCMITGNACLEHLVEMVTTIQFHYNVIIPMAKDETIWARK